MFTVLTCIADQHDSRLLLVALVICVFSAATGVAIYARAAAARGAVQIGWSAFAGFIAGCGVWATHFLSMLAFDDRGPITYAPGLTAVSLAAAVAVLSCGLFLAARSRALAGRLAGGAVVGAGIATMHFVGVAAMTGPTVVGLDRGLVAAAVAIAVAVAAAALGVAGRGTTPRRFWGATALLALAITGLHFTAMAALTLAPGALGATPAEALARLPLASTVAGVIALILAAAIALLVVSSRSARSALQALRSALDVAPGAIAFFDRRRRLTFWNEPYAELFRVFGLTPAIGLRFDDILSSAKSAGVPYRVSRGAAEAGEFGWRNPPDEFELPDGRVIHAKIAPTADGGMVAILVDVTLSRQAEKDANEARERAEEANRLKSDFLATMGHEIRTPLNGVLGMAHVMEAGPLDPAQRERLHVIRSSGEGLLVILNDMLDLAKIEAGYFKLDDCEFDLEATLRPTCEGFAAIAAEKGVAFDLSIAPAAAGQWRGDPQRLKQVVSNLVANAVKFTSVGAVGVSVDTTDKGLRVVVRDTGIGMKAEQIPELFKKFTQADSSSTRKFGGTGLGLAICQELTALMGGELTARSIEGQGSIFALAVPLAHVAPAVFASAKPAAPVLDGRLRILAAEDNLTNQRVLAALLEPLRAEVVMTADGAEALAAYRQGGFDLVLMDIRMPNMNGVEAMAAIRAWESQNGLPQTPILAVTANLMSHDVATYLAAGADGVVGKPILADKLLSSIAEVLPLQQAA